MSSSNEQPNNLPDSNSEAQDTAFELELQRAFASVTPPSDLDARIREHLKLSSHSDSPAAEELDPEQADIVPVQIAASQKAHTNPEWMNKRVSLIAACLVGVAASLAIAMSVLFADRVISDQQLAAVATSGLGTAEAWEPPSPLPDTLYAFVVQNIKVAQVGVVGTRTVASSNVAPKGGQIWKLSSPEGTIYVALLPQLAGTSNLTQQLSLIQDSGNWSIAAAATDSYVVFIASEGDVRRHFKPNRYA